MRLILDYVLDEVMGEDDDTVLHRARRLPGGQPVAIKVAAGHLRGDELRRVEAALRAEADLVELVELADNLVPPVIELIDGGYEPGGGGAPVAVVYDLAGLAGALTDGPTPPPSPRPPRPLPGHRPLPRPAATSPDRRPLVVAALAVVALAVVAAVAAFALTGGHGDRVPAAAPVETTIGPASRAPCPGDAPAVPAGAVAVSGDPTGAGCTVTLVWWPDRAEVDRPEDSGARSRFAVGDPGDQLVLGDWDGDGRDTPGLYDPRRGLLVRFDSWAEPGRALDGTVDPGPVATGGLAGVERRDGGDTIEVRAAPSG